MTAKTKKAILITIGNEILAGDILNTNARYLSENLRDCGLEVIEHITIPDEIVVIQATLKQAAQKAAFVLTTGGLGPTEDDMTLKAAGLAFDRTLVLNQEAKKYIQNLFLKRGLNLSENNLRQAMVPKGAKVLINRVGTAPGVYQRYLKTHYYFFPGVPNELYFLFENLALPLLKNQIKSKDIILSQTYKAFGTSESRLDQKLQKLYTKPTFIDDVQIGFRPQFPQVLIKLTAKAKTKQECQKQLKKCYQKIKVQIGSYIYGKGQDTLAGLVQKKLVTKKQTLAIAESCTGGLLSKMITDESGASRYFVGSVTSYANAVKKSVIKVKPSTLNKKGAVSLECAKEMAFGVAKALNSDFALATTGVAGPTGGTKAKPIGTVFIGVYAKGQTKVHSYCFPVGRERFRKLVCMSALFLLLKAID